MARFIQAGFPTEHAGIDRFTRGFAAIRDLEAAATHQLLGALAVVGTPVRRAAAPLTARLTAWSAVRKQRVEDHKLWSVALRDARVMADLSRAMSADASRLGRAYY